MRLLRRRSAAPPDERRRDTISELERLARRVRALPLAAPVLLLGGFSLGKLTARSLALPEDTPVRIEAAARLPRFQLEALSRHMERLRNDGERTEEYVVLYRDHVGPIEEALRRRGVPDATARNVAWPLVEHAYRRGLDPAMVLSVLLIESRGRPGATSPVGARGLMQVMPDWVGRWRGCGRNLYDIEDNLCHGTSILAWYFNRHDGDERRALLAYNGCVRGTNTPDCFQYPDKVQQIRREIRAELRPGREAAAAASR